MSLARTLYFSRARPDLPFWQTTSEIVGGSALRNARDELTGLLVAQDGWFMQVLEGPAARVSRLLFAISADRRHTNMEIIDFRAVGARQFGDWAMAHAAMTPAIRPVLQRLGLDADSFSPAGLDAGKGLDLLLEAGRQMKLNAA